MILPFDNHVETVTLSGAEVREIFRASIEGERPGTLEFSGATLVSAGTLSLGKESAVSNSSSVTIADGAALAPNTSSSTVPNLTLSDTGTLSFDVASGYSLTVSAVDGVTNSGAAGSVTININGIEPTVGSYPLISYSGSLSIGRNLTMLCSGAPSLQPALLNFDITASSLPLLR